GWPPPTALPCSPPRAIFSARDRPEPTSPTWWWPSGPRAKPRSTMPSGAANVSELFVSFQGEGVHAGRRQLFVRFAGCPLRCRWCDTPDSLLPVAECRVLGADGARRLPNPFSAEALEAEVGALRASSPPLHAMAVTGGEPLAQVEVLVAWVRGRGGDLPVRLGTA